jgi:MFS family permease
MVWIMRRVTFAGCLAMVFMYLSKGAQETEFIRSLGASKFHFGVIGAIMPLMLGLQFISALAINHLPYRKWTWITLMVAHRALVIVLALLPWIFPGGSDSFLVWSFIGLTALGQCMGTFGAPVFMSWMGDLLPKSTQTEFWGSRRKWLSWTGAVTMLLVAGFFYAFKDVDIRVTYLIVAVIGSVAGVLDILLFVKIPERRAQLSTEPHLVRLLQPFRNKAFIRLISWSAMLAFGTMFGAVFIRLFLLEEVGLKVHVVVLLFTCHALGGAMFARSMGRIGDKVGNRPVIVMCTALKALVVLSMALVQPGWWVWLLIPVLMFDNMLNSGLQMSRTGFMLKQSPDENRVMYVTAVLACTGLAAAAGSLTGGYVLEHVLPPDGVQLLGLSVSSFRVVFLISAGLRLLSFGVSLRLHEPGSQTAPAVFMRVIRPAAIRWIQVPWRSLFRSDDEEPSDPQ